MKKIIIGIIIGVGLTLGTSIFADNIQSLIGMKVDATFPVTIEGKKVNEDAVLINGHTYLQVRAMGDALNYDISFDADLGVTLKQKAGGSTVTNNTYGVVQDTVQQIQARHDAQEVIDKSDRDNGVKKKELQGKIKLNQELISINQDKITKVQDNITHLRDGISDPNITVDPTIFNDQIDKLKKENAKLQADNVTAQSQLDALPPSP